MAAAKFRNRKATVLLCLKAPKPLVRFSEARRIWLYFVINKASLISVRYKGKV